MTQQWAEQPVEEVRLQITKYSKTLISLWVEESGGVSQSPGCPESRGTFLQAGSFSPVLGTSKATTNPSLPELVRLNLCLVARETPGTQKLLPGMEICEIRNHQEGEDFKIS